MLLGDFNARVSRSADIYNVIGQFGKDTCNASRNRLVSFLNEVACNGRKLVTEPEWTRVSPSLNQKSFIAQLMKASGYVHVDRYDAQIIT